VREYHYYRNLLIRENNTEVWYHWVWSLSVPWIWLVNMLKWCLFHFLWLFYAFVWS